jgi:hypothetical protein
MKNLTKFMTMVSVLCDAGDAVAREAGHTIEYRAKCARALTFDMLGLAYRQGFSPIPPEAWAISIGMLPDESPNVTICPRVLVGGTLTETPCLYPDGVICSWSSDDNRIGASTLDQGDSLRAQALLSTVIGRQVTR